MPRVTRVTPFVLVADVRDQCFRTLQLDFECGNQRIFRVYNDVASLPLHLKTDGKLQLRSSLVLIKPIASATHSCSFYKRQVAMATVLAQGLHSAAPLCRIQLAQPLHLAQRQPSRHRSRQTLVSRPWTAIG